MVPPSVLNARVEAGFARGPVVLVAPIAVAIWLGFWTAAQVRRLNSLDVDRVVRPHEGERRLMVNVGSLAADVLMLSGTVRHGLRSALAPLLAARDALLRLL